MQSIAIPTIPFIQYAGHDPDYMQLGHVLVEANEVEAASPIAKGSAYDEIKACLELLKRSRKNLACYRRFNDRNNKIRGLWACQDFAATLCLCGIPAVVFAGALACTAYIASRRAAFTVPLLEATARRKALEDEVKRMRAKIQSPLGVCIDKFYDNRITNVVACQRDVEHENALVEESIAKFIREHATEKAALEQGVLGWQEAMLQGWEYPLYIFFILTCACSLSYCAYLLWDRKRAREDYTHGFHPKAQCLKPEDAPRIADLTKRLDLSALTSIEELIAELDCRKLQEAYKETLFLFCAFLCENQFPVDLILLLLRKSLELPGASELADVVSAP